MTNTKSAAGVGSNEVERSIEHLHDACRTLTKHPEPSTRRNFALNNERTDSVGKYRCNIGST